MNKLYRVAIIGSGNFGSAIAKIVGQNTLRYKGLFHPQVNMWVHEEIFQGEKLSVQINKFHENVKYLPGVKFPSNIVAKTDMESTIKGANVLLFIMPHQYLKVNVDKITRIYEKNKKPAHDPNAGSPLIACSMIKGLDIGEDGPTLLSDIIAKGLSPWCRDVSVVMGANIAKDIVKEDSFCETTIGTTNSESGEILRKLLQASYFEVNVVKEVKGVEMCGALKNVVACAVGVAKGLNAGPSTWSAIIRIGLLEIRRFNRIFFNDSNYVVDEKIYMESCGIADLIATCVGGRNARVCEAWAKSKGEKSIQELEKELLNGQKLQGTITAKELYAVLKKRQVLDKFPLFTATYEIFFQGKDPKTIFKIRNYKITSML